MEKQLKCKINCCHLFLGSVTLFSQKNMSQKMVTRRRLLFYKAVTNCELGYLSSFSTINQILPSHSIPLIVVGDLFRGCFQLHKKLRALAVFYATVCILKFKNTRCVVRNKLRSRIESIVRICMINFP